MIAGSQLTAFAANSGWISANESLNDLRINNFDIREVAADQTSHYKYCNAH
jgi:hypothetical protein